MSLMAERIPRAILLVTMTAAGCQTAIKSNEKPAWQDLRRVEVTELLRIGSDVLANEPYVFSGIHDLRFDAADNVYILDRKESVIKVFSPAGHYVRAYPLPKGQGPGELEQPRGFDIGPNGDLYVADMMSRRIVKIDQAGNHIDTMTLRARLGSIAVDLEGNVFTTGGLLESSDQTVHKYRFPDGKLMKAFCLANALSQWIGRVGMSGVMCLNSRGNVLYSFSIPYDIREFTPNGELVRRFGRKISGWKPPQVSSQGLPDSPVFALDMDTFPDGKILQVVIDRRVKPYVTYYDVFDEQGTWLISIDSREFIKDGTGLMVRIDSRGDIYAVFWEPFPHVRKYRLNFVPIKGGS